MSTAPMSTTAPTDLHDRLDDIATQLEVLAAEARRSQERWEVLDELVRDATPVMRQAFGSATTRFEALEARGYPEFVGGGLGMVDRIVGTLGRGDLEALGDRLVPLLEAVRNMARADTTASEPPSVMALAGRLRRPDARRGLDRLVRLLEVLGAAHPGPTGSPKEGTA